MSKKKRIESRNKKVQGFSAMLRGIGALLCFVFVMSGVFSYFFQQSSPKVAIGSVFIGFAFFVFFALASKMSLGFEQKYKPPKEVVPETPPAPSTGQGTNQHMRAFMDNGE